MTLERQLSLLPKRLHQGRAPLHLAQPSRSQFAHRLKVACTQVADFSCLEITPDVFGRIKFRGVSGKELDLNGAVALDVVAHDVALVRPQTIPHDEHRPRDVVAST